MNALDVPVCLDQLNDRLDQVLQTTTDPATRTTHLTDLLRQLWPDASLHACLLMDSGEPSLAVLDETGNRSTSWLKRLDPQGKPLEELASLWSSLLEGAGQTVLVQPLARAGAWHGLAALRLMRTADPREQQQAKTVLATFAQMLALNLSLEACRRDFQDQQRLANVGELAGVAAHEFTNFLNVLLLQVNMLEWQLPEHHRADLAELRRQGNVAADLVRQFQEYRHGQPPPARQVNLAEAIAEVVEELRGESLSPLPLQLALARGRLLIEVSRPALQRLLRFLVTNSIRAAAHNEGQVDIHAQNTGANVILRVEDSGPSVAAKELAYLFDPLRPGREGVDVLELAACKALARRQGGSIRAEERSGGGVSFVVEWPSLS